MKGTPATTPLLERQAFHYLSACLVSARPLEVVMGSLAEVRGNLADHVRNQLVKKDSCYNEADENRRF